MKKAALLLLALTLTAPALARGVKFHPRASRAHIVRPSDITGKHVSGYYRKDGTYVRPHWSGGMVKDLSR